MEYNIRTARVADVVEVSGRIAASESMDLTRRLEAHLSGDSVRGIVLDLSRVDYMSSAGLGTVVWLGKRMREAKRGYAISGLRDRVAQVFKLSGLDRILPIYPDLAAAEAALEERASGGGASAGQ
jgi:anti-anti-sigma factor